MSDRVPGWYPQEDDPATQRYWNGVEWTGDTRPADPEPQSAPEPEPEPAAPPAAEPAVEPLHVQLEPEPAAAPPRSRRPLLVAGGLAAAALVAVVLVVVATSGSDGDDGADAEVATQADEPDEPDESDADDGGAGEEAEGQDETDGEASGGGLTYDQLINSLVPTTSCGEPGQLVDGVYEAGTDPAEGRITVDDFDGDGELAAYVGDLTGDGVDDGFLIATYTGGANYICSVVVAYDADGELLGEVLLEEASPVAPPGGWVETYVADGRLVDGAIELDLSSSSFLSSDAMCCPSGGTTESTATFVWTDDGFLAAS